MAKLIWKKDPPKEPGHYWVCEDGFLECEGCYVITYFFEDLSGKIICDKEQFFKDESWRENFLFAGPIPLPKKISTK